MKEKKSREKVAAVAQEAEMNLCQGDSDRIKQKGGELVSVIKHVQRYVRHKGSDYVAVFYQKREHLQKQAADLLPIT